MPSPFACLLCWTARDVRRSSPWTSAELSEGGTEEGESGAIWFFECLEEEKRSESDASELGFGEVGKKKTKTTSSLFSSALLYPFAPIFAMIVRLRSR